MMLKRFIKLLDRPNRSIGFIIGFYALMAAAHTLWVQLWTDQRQWFYVSFGEQFPVLFFFVLIPALVGLILLAGAFRHTLAWTRVGLMLSTMYHTLYVVLNIYSYDGKGTPWLAASFITLLSAFLYLRSTWLDRGQGVGVG
jgi:hypothetical protein